MTDGLTPNQQPMEDSTEPAADGRSDLPDFDAPPVIEVVCGVQFSPLGFPAPLVGTFWQDRRDDYPGITDRPLIAPRVEKFTSQAEGLNITFEPSEAPPLPRTVFEDSSGNWILQLQQDRLLHNWRKADSEDEYPRFPGVYDRFRAAWEAWKEFWAEEGDGDIDVNQYELTYVNHVPAGDGWSELSQIGEVFEDLRWHSDHQFLPQPESLNWRLQFPLPNRAGRLHVAVQQALRRSDHRPVLVCEMTARGFDRESSMEDWFLLAREWIVRGFADLTTEHAHKEIWRRTR